MLKTVLTTVTVLMLVAGTAAQQTQPTPAPVREAQPIVPPATAQPSMPVPRTPAQLVNIRLDLTITDQRSDGAPMSKTVTIVVADRENGRIRSEGRDSGNRAVTLNVDGRAEIVRDGRIRVYVTLEYRPVHSETGALMPITESLTAILDDGKPLVVSQSADPASDRRVRVELKATVLK